jgi:hypothetical protein
MISTVIFPLVGLRLRVGRAATDVEEHLDVDAGVEMPILDRTTPSELGQAHQ